MTKTETALVVPAAQDYALMQMSLEDVREALQENLDGSQLSMWSFPRIRIPGAGGTTWSVPQLEGDDLETKVLEGVIVYKQSVRGYYKDEFKGGNSPPDCASKDGNWGQGAYGPDSVENPTGNCLTCPMSQFNPTPACKQSLLLFLLMKDDLLPVVVKASPGSLRPMNDYLRGLARKAKPYYSVVTKLALTKASSATGITYSQIAPSLGSLLSKEEVERFKDLKAQLQARFATMVDWNEYVVQDDTYSRDQRTDEEDWSPDR